ncbi:MAG: patatin-like phospholipase family protein [Gemmatimonadales bacterium]
MTTERLVVVLGGGGAKAAAHAGAHRAMLEARLRPVHYVATSMGAVFAALFAGGLTDEAVLERVAAVRTRDVVVPDPWVLFRGVYRESVLKPGPLRATLERLVPVRRFEQLRVPLTVTTTDLDSRELMFFGAGGEDAPLLDVLYASCALPVFYPPAVIGGRRLGDGGLRAVLPIEVALRFAPDLVLAVDVGPGFDEAPALQPEGLPPMVQAHSDATAILMAANAAAELALWRSLPARPPLVYVRPRVERGATFRVDRLRRYADEGHRATAAALAEWKG